MSDSFKPVEKQSLADAVFDQLRRRILAGGLKPGESLPAERALAEMLDVNRGAVREALKRLEQARLISIRHGGSTRVLDFRQTAGTDLLHALLIDEAGHIDLPVARSILEMRSALAPSIARYCARRGREVLDELDEILADMEDAGQDLPRLQAASLEFWGILVRGSDNIAYELAFNSLRDSYEHFADLLTTAMADEFLALPQYRQLRDAVAAGDEDAAAAAGAEITGLGEQALTGLLQTLAALSEADDDGPAPR